LIPALLLLVVAVLNLLVSGYLVVNAFVLQNFTTEQFRTQMRASNPNFDNQEKELEAGGYSLDKVKQMAELGCHGFGWGGLVVAMFIAAGAVCMLSMRYYGVAVLASFFAIIPCISGTACCCLGEIIGLWALVTLLNADVRAAFR